MSYKRVRTLGDCARFGLWVELICANAGCGRVRMVDPTRLIAIFGASAEPAAIGARLRCQGEDLEGGGCGHRGAIVRFKDDPPPEPPTGGAPAQTNVVPLGGRQIRPIAPPTPAARRRASGKLPYRTHPAGIDRAAWDAADESERKRLIARARNR